MTDICKAWRTEALGVVSLVYAATLAQARFATWKAARNAGYGVKFGDIRVRREPRLDAPQAQCQRRKCLEYTEAEVPR